jgi:macrocin-O-methyltransferase TylF-like protien
MSLVPGWVKSSVVRLLRRAGYQLLNVRKMQRSAAAADGPAPIAKAYDCDGLFTEHRPRFQNDPRFQAAWQRGLATNRGVDPGIEWRIHIGLWAASVAARVPGDFVECGVNAGFLSSAILTYLDWPALSKKFYLVDTFAGPPMEQFSEGEVENGAYAKVLQSLMAGAYVTDMETIRRNYLEWPGIEIVQGVVPEVLPAVKAREVAFLHLDMNCAYAEMEALRYFWDRLSRGGVVLLDDYSRKDYEPVGDAMDELAARLGAGIASLPTGQGMIIK